MSREPETFDRFDAHCKVVERELWTNWYRLSRYDARDVAGAAIVSVAREIVEALWAFDQLTATLPPEIIPVKESR